MNWTGALKVTEQFMKSVAGKSVASSVLFGFWIFVGRSSVEVDENVEDVDEEEDVDKEEELEELKLFEMN